METKPEKLLYRSLFAVVSLWDYKTTILLPTLMAALQLYMNIAQQPPFFAASQCPHVLTLCKGGTVSVFSSSCCSSSYRCASSILCRASPRSSQFQPDRCFPSLLFKQRLGEHTNVGTAEGNQLLLVLVESARPCCGQSPPFGEQPLWYLSVLHSYFLPQQVVGCLLAPNCVLE